MSTGLEFALVLRDPPPELNDASLATSVVTPFRSTLLMSALHQRRPWPMKWIIIVIIAIIVPYTFLTLRYRKPGPAFEPYDDIKKQANVSRLLEAGYRRIAIAAQRFADGAPARGGASISAVTGGLPADLRRTLVEVPLLPVEIMSVTAAATATTLQPYAIQFTCALPDNKQQLSGAELFVRGANIVITPTFEPTGGLQARTPRAEVLLTVPAGVIAPGSYTLTLVAERASQSWPLEVK